MYIRVLICRLVTTSKLNPNAKEFNPTSKPANVYPVSNCIIQLLHCYANELRFL